MPQDKFSIQNSPRLGPGTWRYRPKDLVYTVRLMIPQSVHLWYKMGRTSAQATQRWSYLQVAKTMLNKKYGLEKKLIDDALRYAKGKTEAILRVEYPPQ